MRYAVWVAIPGMGDVPDQVAVEAPDADSAILRAGMTVALDLGEGPELKAIVVEVRDEAGRLAE